MTKVLQNKGNGLGFLRHWKVMTMTLLLLIFSIGQMWGAATNITTSLFIQTYAEKTGSSAPDNSALTSDFPSYLTYSLSSAANIAGNVSTITSPHDFSSMSSTAKLYHLKMGSSNTITLTEVSNVKSITLYGAASNANRVVRATFKTAVGDVAANAYVNGATWAQEYNQSSTTTVTAHKINISSVTGYSASDAYTIELKSTSGGDYHIYGIYIEAGSGSGCSEPAAPTISGTASYNEGETITLTASHEGSNHTATTTYQWFKGATFATATSVQAAATGAAGYTFTKSAALSDAGTYWCEAANSTCKSHNVDGKAVTVNAAAVCPDGISISGTAAYTEGETIELTAALTKGNGTISYQWYKGSIAVGNEVGTGATFTKATCTTGDAGNYFCVATKDACSDEESSAYAVTVDPAPATGTISDLVEISDDYVYTPTEGLESNTLYEGNRFISIGDGNPYTSGKGIRIKENRALAFKVAANAKVKVTFVTNGDLEMQLGTATSDDDNKVYGHSKTSPVTFDVITTGGVIYLTASNQLDMSKLEIFYPHSVTYALGDGTGTLPTESAHYNGDKFDLHDGETNISAPEGKEFAGWNDGTSTKAGGTQYTMGATAVTLTAQWATPLPEPAITFNNGAYTIGGDALNLTSLFSSNSDGAVTYTVKTAGETGAAIAGTSFTATTAGSAVVTASQAATASYKAKSVDATITVSAPSEPDGVKLVEAGALTGNFRCGRSLSDGSSTVGGISYSKYVSMGSTYTSWGPDAGPSNKYFSYTVQKKSTKFYFYLNNTGSAAKIHLYKSAEGSAAAATKVDIDVAAGTSVVTYDLATTTNTEVFIGVSSTNIRFCQIVAVESGDSHLLAPAVGYAMSLNKGRLSTASGTATTIDGLTFVVGSGYKPAYSTAAQIGTKETHYVSFTIPTGQTRQLQLTTSNNAKYTVSKTLGDEEDQYTPTADEATNWNLEAGTWYINPQGSNVNITNIAFAAAPAQKTVTFKDGASTLDTKYVWSGETVSALSPAPTKSGYRFVKWQLSGADYDFATPVTDNIVLDAVWQEVVVVTFDPNNGEDTFTKTADKGAVLAVGDRPADPTYVGYDFQGWTRNAAAEPIVYVNLATETFDAAATLTAVWEVAQTDASLSALSYNGNAIDVNSAVEVAGVQTYTVHLQWGSTINAALISVTKSADPATMTPIAYDSENKRASFMVTSGNGTVSINYAIQFVIDAKIGTSIVKAVISGGNQSAGFAATGIYGDKGYAVTKSDRKLDTGGKYVGVKLLSGKTFAAGDKLYVVTTTAANMGYIELYEEAAGTTLIKATDVRDASAGIEIPSELVGHSEFYIVRKGSTGDQAWNGTVNYVEVTREMSPAIKSFKFGDDAATINEAAKTITIEVPFSTDVTALTPTVEAYGNNGATYTPSGATDFTSPVDYVVTDAYSEFSTTYAVTVNKAAASTNADLASLAVAGYSLDFDPATTSYNIVLDYGTTVLPAITYEVAEVGLATAVKVEDGVNGATTITVTPQAGAGYEKVYTINFSVSTTPKFVIYDGSTMSDYAESGSDLGTGFAWTVVGGSHSAKNTDITLNGKTYTKAQNIFGSATKGPNEGNTRYITITIPEGYLAKFYLAGATNSDESLRSSYISKEITGTLDESIAYVSSDQYAGAAMRSNYQLPGTYYYCSDASIRLYELSVTLYPIDYSRNLTEGRFGTICLPNGGVMVGAALFEVAYHDATLEKIFFDEILNGEMIAGRPYIFLPNEGVSALAVTYTDAAGALAGNYHGLYGSYTQQVLAQEAGNYILYNNQYMYVGASSSNVSVGANRAYFKLAEIPTNAVAPLPGRRRVSMSAVRETPTGLENGELINGENGVQKVLINGELFILRGEKMYDATGRLVK